MSLFRKGIKKDMRIDPSTYTSQAVAENVLKDVVQDDEIEDYDAEIEAIRAKKEAREAQKAKVVPNQEQQVVVKYRAVSQEDLLNMLYEQVGMLTEQVNILTDSINRLTE